MNYITDDKNLKASINKSWNFKNGNSLVSEDIAVFMSLITQKGKDKAPMDKVIMSLISMFSEVDGLYELFKQRMEGFEFEKKSINGISLQNIKFSKDYRDAFNYLKLDYKNYIAKVQEMAIDCNEDIISQALSDYSQEIKYEYSVVTKHENIKDEYSVVTKHENIKDENEKQKIPRKEENRCVNAETIGKLDNLVVDENLKNRIINDYEEQRLLKQESSVHKKLKEHFNELSLSLIKNNKNASKGEMKQVQEKGVSVSQEQRKIEIDNATLKGKIPGLKIEAEDDISEVSLEMLNNKELIKINEKKNEMREELKERGLSEGEIEDEISSSFRIDINEDDFYSEFDDTEARI